MNDARFLKALKGENLGPPPIWLMRQAGRYLPEYRMLREKQSFVEMCKRPEVAAEVTLQPIRRFGFDAAILFSDILVIPDALGLGLNVDEGIGPWFERPLTSLKDIDDLACHDLTHRLSYVNDAITLLTKELRVPLLGFSGAPFTLASYMIEGKTSREMRKTKLWMLSHPSRSHRLLDKLSDWIIEYLRMQKAAGVQAAQLFDSWVHVLAEPQFREFSLHYLKKIVNKAKEFDLPVILFCRGSSLFAPLMAEARPQAISVDWNGHLPNIRKQVPQSIALQGNLDPHILFAPKEKIASEVKSLAMGMQGDPAYIFNLGHGIMPGTPIDAVHTLIETLRCESQS